MKLLRPLADRRNANSLSRHFRRRRNRLLLRLLSSLEPPVRVLDVGGEPTFWDELELPPATEVVILNIDPIGGGRFIFVQGDARDLSRFGNGSFDLVVSNSVIEHMPSDADQETMAREIRRVGRRWYVQTPNRWLPIDPHYLVPGYHWLPRELRIRLLLRFNVGWLTRASSREEAERIVDTIRPLTASRLMSLFPDGTLWRERVLGMTKSLVVYRE